MNDTFQILSFFYLPGRMLSHYLLFLERFRRNVFPYAPRETNRLAVIHGTFSLGTSDLATKFI